MNTPDANDPLTRWLDGVMSPQEHAAFEAEMLGDPVLRAEAASLKELRALLQEHVRMEAAVPHADFFNSQVQERIGEFQRASRQEVKGPLVMSVLSWLTRRWALTGLAAAAVLGFFAWQSLSLDDGSRVVGFYAPDSGIKAHSYEDRSANAAVLELDGVPDIPDDKLISGVTPSSTRNDPETATTTLYDAHGGVLLAMAADGGGTPHLLTH